MPIILYLQLYPYHAQSNLFPNWKILQSIATQHRGWHVYEIDNLSEKITLQYYAQLIRQESSRLIILIENQEPTHSYWQVFSPLLEAFYDKSEMIEAIFWKGYPEEKLEQKLTLWKEKKIYTEDFEEILKNLHNI
ncbi:MAG: hypothetical protein EAZ55_00515 [Cytophagales bacterium]|nr:MAG: hypothetical protein EAZ55_00515 [Cytophagales bacterium]